MKRICLFLILIIILSNGLRAQWTKTTLPYGGDVNCLSTAGDNIFAGTYLHGGVYFSSDKGSTWVSRSLDVKSPVVQALVFHNNKIYAGTAGNGILQSSDSGKTWTSINKGLTQIIRSIAFINDKMFAGTGAGIYVSGDDGQNWAQTGMVLAPYSVTTLGFKDNLIFAGTWDAGMFVSSDGGVTFSTINAGLTSRFVRCFAIKGDNIYVGTAGGGIFMSSDNGGRWYSRSDGLVNYFVDDIKVSGDLILAATQDGFFLSADNGTKWDKKSNGLSEPFVSSIAISGSTIYTGTIGSGVFKSEDTGSNWTSSNNGLSNLSINSFASIGNTVFAGTDYGGVFKSVDSLSKWSPVNEGLSTKYIQALTVLNNKIIAGTVSSGIFVSTDNGLNWSESDAGLLSPQIYTMITVGPNIFIGTNDGVFLSGDAASTWTIVSNGLPKGNAHALSFSGDQIYSAVGFNGVYRSVDNGKKWSDINNDFLRGAYLYTLASRDSSVYAGTAYGVYYSKDIGLHWENVDYGLKTNFVNYLTFVGETLVAGTDSGLFAFNKKDLSWSYYSNDSVITKSLNTDYLSSSVTVLKYTGKYLFAGSKTGDIFSKKLNNSAITDSNTEPLADKEKILIYPNPAYNVLYLNVVVDDGTVLIFDLRGKLVFNRHVSGNMIDISQLNNGMYILKISFTNKTFTGKFVKK